MTTTPITLVTATYAQSVDTDPTGHGYSNRSASCEQYAQDIKKAIGPVIFPIALFIAFFSLCSNFCNIVVLSRRKMINATNSILTGMAVCDLTTCVFYIIRSIITHFVNVNIMPTIKHITIISLMVCNTSHTFSSWLTVLLSIFRFFIIHSAYASPRSSDVWGLSRSLTCMLLIGSAVVLFNVPVYSTVRVLPFDPGNRTGLAGQPQQLPNQTMYFARFVPKSFSIYNFASNAILAKVIPCILLLFFGILLLVTLHKADKRRMSLMEESRSTLSGGCGGKGLSRRERNSRRITRMLLTVIIIFVLVELPNGCLMCVTRFNLYARCIYTAFGEICDLASLTKNAVSFVLYCSMSTEFRSTFRSTFCKCLKRKAENGNGTNNANDANDRKTVTTAAFVVDHLTAKGKAGGYSQAL